MDYDQTLEAKQPYMLRQSKSGPAILKGGFRQSKSGPEVVKHDYSLNKCLQFQTAAEENRLNTASGSSSIDSLYILVFDQVQTLFRNFHSFKFFITGPPKPPGNNINKSDFAFLLDAEGGGGLCFQALLQEDTNNQ